MSDELDIIKLRLILDLSVKIINLRDNYNLLSFALKKFAKQLGSDISIKILLKSLSGAANSMSKFLIPGFNAGSKAAIGLSKNISQLGRTSIDLSEILSLSLHILTMYQLMQSLDDAGRLQILPLILILLSQKLALIKTAAVQLEVNKKLASTFASIDKIASIPLVNKIPFIDTIVDKTKTAISKTTFLWAMGLAKMKLTGTSVFTKLGTVLKTSLKTAIIAGTAGLAALLALATAGILWFWKKLKEAMDVAKLFLLLLLSIQKSAALSNRAFARFGYDPMHMLASSLSINAITLNFLRIPKNVNAIRSAMDKLNISFGISGSSSAKLFNNLNKVAGLNTKQANDFIRNVVGNAQRLGFNQKQIVLLLASVPGSILAAFRNSKLQFAQMVLMSKAAGADTLKTTDLMLKLANIGLGSKLLGLLKVKIPGLNVDAGQMISRAQAQDPRVVFDLLKLVATKYNFNNMYLNKLILSLLGYTVDQISKLKDISYLTFKMNRQVVTLLMKYYTMLKQYKMLIRARLLKFGNKFYPIFTKISAAFLKGTTGIFLKLGDWASKIDINALGKTILTKITSVFNWIKDEGLTKLINGAKMFSDIIKWIWKKSVGWFGTKLQKSAAAKEDWLLGLQKYKGMYKSGEITDVALKWVMQGLANTIASEYDIKYSNLSIQNAINNILQKRAIGGTITSPLALVGLNGPLLIRAPKNSKVSTAGLTKSIMSGNTDKILQLLTLLITLVKKSNNIYIDGKKVNDVLYSTNKVIRNNG